MPFKKSIRIGLWGGICAGKATYLTALYRYLSESEYWSLRVHPGFSERIVDYAYDMDSGKFPESGFVLPKNYDYVQSYTYTLIPKKKHNVNQVVLSFLAAPGKFYETCFQENIPIIENQHKYDNAVEYYLSFDGIIMLLDDKKAASASESYHRLLGDFFTFLQRHWQESDKGKLSQKLPHYFAFCLSKADIDDTKWNRIEESGIKKAQESLFILAERTLGKRAFSILSGACYFNLNSYDNPRKNRCLFYHLSSIGRSFEDGQYRISTSDIDSDIDSDPSSSPSSLKNNSEDFILENNITKVFAGEDNLNFPKEESLYLSKKPRSLIKSPSSLEALNVFSPLQRLIDSSSQYLPS